MTARSDTVKYGVHIWRCEVAPVRPRFASDMAATNGIGKWPDAVSFMEMIGIALNVDVADEEGVKKIAATTGVAERYIYRWRAGKNRPSLGEALAMLRSARLLRSAEEVGADPVSPDRILERLGDAVAKLAESHREAMADIDEVRDRLEQAEAALAVSQAPTTRKRKKPA